MAEPGAHASRRAYVKRVTPRSLAFSFRDKGIDAREIGRRLNAGSVLEGSVRRAGQRLRISAQLINIADGYPIWSERFDRALTDIFEVQDEITATVVRQLRQRLLGEPADQQAPVVKRFTEDAEAYSLFLKRTAPLEQTARWNPCGDQVFPEGAQTRSEIRPRLCELSRRRIPQTGVIVSHHIEKVHRWRRSDG